MIAAYLRVSSKSQDKAMQKAAIERVASSRGDQVERWHSEERSGRTLQRPELDRLRPAEGLTGRGAGQELAVRAVADANEYTGH